MKPFLIVKSVGLVLLSAMRRGPSRPTLSASQLGVQELRQQRPGRGQEPASGQRDWAEDRARKVADALAEDVLKDTCPSCDLDEYDKIPLFRLMNARLQPDRPETICLTCLSVPITAGFVLDLDDSMEKLCEEVHRDETECAYEEPGSTWDERGESPPENW